MRDRLSFSQQSIVKGIKKRERNMHLLSAQRRISPENHQILRTQKSVSLQKDSVASIRHLFVFVVNFEKVIKSDKMSNVSLTK